MIVKHSYPVCEFDADGSPIIRPVDMNTVHPQITREKEEEARVWKG